jgi:membrane-associated phospholipid phosphatase
MAAVGGIVALTVLIDAPVARTMESSRSPGRTHTAQQLDRFGEVSVIAPVIGGLALAGVVTHRPALTRLARQTTTAIALSTVISQASKRIIGRHRPYEDQDRSGLDFAPLGGGTALPSGHTAAAFALATTLGDASGSRWATAGFYTLATGTAWARMAQEKHWLSDVVAGAAVGILSARLANGRIVVTHQGAAMRFAF